MSDFSLRLISTRTDLNLEFKTYSCEAYPEYKFVYCFPSEEYQQNLWDQCPVKSEGKNPPLSALEITKNGAKVYSKEYQNNFLPYKSPEKLDVYNLIKYLETLDIEEVNGEEVDYEQLEDFAGFCDSLLLGEYSVPVLLRHKQERYCNI